MQIATFIDRRDTTTDLIYGFGPNGRVFVAIKDAGGFMYKIFSARKLPMLDVLNWPAVYGVVAQPASPGSNLIFQTFDIWTQELKQFHFLSGQDSLIRRVEALKAIVDAEPIYLKTPPKWVTRYMPTLFGF